MFNEKSFIAVIPARGGSKRLPHKNRLILNDKPLVAWTIEAAVNSDYLDTIILSSDDDKILEIGSNYQIENMKRPSHISADNSSSFDVLEHIIHSIQKKYDYIVLLQPTSPLRSAQHINEAIEYLVDRQADAVISVCECAHSPLWMNKLPSNLSLENFLKPEIKNKRSQDLEKYYQLNGAIYICKVERLLKDKTLFFDSNIFAYEMEKENSVDIDEWIDFKLVELLLKERIQ